ncbi:hypothetical protein [Actinophytocola sp.]|uniref:hypothetical protein n=1 Tax=Actinophytocola sp. TaxID=1872138 RepID=UPI003D6B26E0
MTAAEEGGVLPPYRRVSAETLRLATEATGAPEYLRRLARAVRHGEATWAEIADGNAEDLPEVQDINAVVAEQTQALIERACAGEASSQPDQSDWDDDEPQDGGILRKR